MQWTIRQCFHSIWYTKTNTKQQNSNSIDNLYRVQFDFTWIFAKTSCLTSTAGTVELHDQAYLALLLEVAQRVQTSTTFLMKAQNPRAIHASTVELLVAQSAVCALEAAQRVQINITNLYKDFWLKH